MTTLGLTATERKAYFAALGSDTQVVQEVRLLTLSHKLVATVTPVALDGQVNYTGASRGVTRTLQVGFSDPDHAIALDSESPSAGVAGMNRLIQVRTHVLVPALDRWVACGTFVGRPSVLSRDGDVVTVEADSKECLHMRTIAAGHIKKGSNYVGSIKYLLRLSGETRFRLPTGIKRRLSGNVHYGGTDSNRTPWHMACVLAGHLGYQLFYDGDGYACLRRPPATPAWTLTESGEGANLLTRVKRTTNLTTVRNRVVVTGRKGNKAFTRVVDAHTYWPTHPFTARNLAVNGTSWYDAEYVDDPNLHTTGQAITYGRNRLKSLLTENTSVSANAIPVWHLEPGDLVAMHAGGVSWNHRWSEASVPLGPADEGMSVGFMQRVRSASAGRVGR